MRRNIALIFLTLSFFTAASSAEENSVRTPPNSCICKISQEDNNNCVVTHSTQKKWLKDNLSLTSESVSINDYVSSCAQEFSKVEFKHYMPSNLDFVILEYGSAYKYFIKLNDQYASNLSSINSANIFGNKDMRIQLTKDIEEAISSAKLKCVTKYSKYKNCVVASTFTLQALLNSTYKEQ